MTTNLTTERALPYISASDQFNALRDALEEACEHWHEHAKEAYGRRMIALDPETSPGMVDRAFKETREFARLDSLREIAFRGFQPGDYCHVCGRVGSHDEQDELSYDQRLSHVAEDASQNRG